MREVSTDEITKNIKEMCIEANYILSDDVKNKIINSAAVENSEIGKKILSQLEENMEIAEREQIPICQDTGMAVVFIKVGQEVHITGGNLEDAINQGVREGYTEGYLRKSVVKDPLIRENTKDNTPAIIHYEIIPGDKVEITVAPKGFGSENMSRVCMLKPADGIEGVKNAVIETVKLAGPNACPPVEYVAELENELLDEINNLNIGPGGLGGKITALGVNIETYPTHIAGLPVAINMCCHVNRHNKRILLKL